MRILITGSGGMLGQDLSAQLSARHQVLPFTRTDADIADAGRVAEMVIRGRPDVLVHVAASTAVDECERNAELAFRVNAQGTRNLALACQRSRIPMLYLSTDYVFDGKKTEPYLEEDLPNPINVYGQSKLQGEKHVMELLERCWIVRTSWLFGPHGKNFVRAILEHARKSEPLRVVDDQAGAPTYTMDLAGKLEQILERGGPGIYHATNQGYCSWFEFAREILRQAGFDPESLARIASAASGRLARRPANSRLANFRLQVEGLGLLPPWQDALRRYLLRAPC